jgi:hypothetical protein
MQETDEKESRKNQARSKKEVRAIGKRGAREISERNAIDSKNTRTHQHHTNIMSKSHQHHTKTTHANASTSHQHHTNPQADVPVPVGPSAPSAPPIV